MSSTGSLWFHLIWDSLCFLYMGVYFLHQIRKIFSHYLFKYFFCSFLSLFFWDPYNVNINVLDFIPSFLRLSFFVDNVFFFSFCCSYWMNSTSLFSKLLSFLMHYPISSWFPLLYFLFLLLYFSALIFKKNFFFVEVLSVFVHSP